MALVTIQAEGQMTIPPSIREALGIKAGTQLVCIQTGRHVFECHMLPQPMGLRAYLDTHSFEGPEITQEDIDAAVHEGMRAEIEAEYGDLLPDATGSPPRRGQKGA
jgi:AbrB family looped-hinge helix DNA binding protein